MFSRRKFVQGCSVAAGAAAVSGSGMEALAQHGRVGRMARAASIGDVTKYVNIFVGTGGHGHTFPGATVPFGAMQLSPDTGNSGWDWCSGYHHMDSSIMGFSHTHLSGTGGGDLLDFLVVPRVGEVRLVAGDKKQPDTGYRTRFSHNDEHAEPGYYSVKLASGVLAELTATERVGVHRYTFPAGAQAHLLLDMVHCYESSDDMNAPQPVEFAEVKVVGGNTLMGGRKSHRWTPKRQLYFAMVFEKPFAKVQLYSDRKPVDGMSAEGKTLHAAIYPDASGPVIVKVGISMVSADNALANVKAEVPEFDFAATRVDAKNAWQRELSRIAVDSYDVPKKTIFYSSLYHMMCAPTLADDVNGEYRGMDQKVYKLDTGQHNYSTYSLWDTFPGAAPKLHLVAAGPGRPDGDEPCADGRAEPRWHSNLAAAGRRNILHDGLPLRQRHGGGVRQGFSGCGLEAGLCGDAQAQHGRRL